MSGPGGTRRRAREVALQILYAMETYPNEDPEAARTLFENFRVPQTERDFASRLITGVIWQGSEIDGRIDKASEHWRMPRLTAVDRNVLRLAVFELLYCPDIPPEVTINEAIEIAKRYGTEGSGAFVNGVLDRIHKEEAAQI